MNKPAVGIVLLAFSFLASLHCMGQAIDGRISTITKAPIPGVNIKLSTSLGNQGPVISTQTDSEGYFNIQILKDDIKSANQKGATWSLIIEGSGYIRVTRNIFVTPDKIVPSTFYLELVTNPYAKNYPFVDGCIIEDRKAITLYLFDLESDKNSATQISLLLNTMRDKMKSEIINYFETYELSRGLTLEMARCSGFKVEEERFAVHYGQRLNASGVVWGYGQSRDSLNTVISLTSLEEPPLSGRTTISYSNDITEIVEISRRVPKEYLAFATYILGKVHLEKGNRTSAKRCFNNVRDLNALPPEYQQSLNVLLKSLKGDISYSLKPLSN